MLVRQGNHQLDFMVYETRPALQLAWAIETQYIPVEHDGLFDVLDPQHGHHTIEFHLLFSEKKCSCNPDFRIEIIKADLLVKEK